MKSDQAQNAGLDHDLPSSEGSSAESREEREKSFSRRALLLWSLPAAGIGLAALSPSDARGDHTDYHADRLGLGHLDYFEQHSDYYEDTHTDIYYDDPHLDSGPPGGHYDWSHLDAHDDWSEPPDHGDYRDDTPHGDEWHADHPGSAPAHTDEHMDHHCDSWAGHSDYSDHDDFYTDHSDD